MARQRCDAPTGPATGVNDTVTLYSGCAPSPTGHQRLMSPAAACSVSVALLSPAGSVTGISTEVFVLQLPVTVSMPFTATGDQKCVRTAQHQHQSNSEPTTRRSTTIKHGRRIWDAPTTENGAWFPSDSGDVGKSPV
jgi:hypothetical protein